MGKESSSKRREAKTLKRKSPCLLEREAVEFDSAKKQEVLTATVFKESLDSVRGKKKSKKHDETEIDVAPPPKEKTLLEPLHEWLIDRKANDAES